jgi:hypothetical protein
MSYFTRFTCTGRRISAVSAELPMGVLQSMAAIALSSLRSVLSLISSLFSLSQLSILYALNHAPSPTVTICKLYHYYYLAPISQDSIRVIKHTLPYPGALLVCWGIKSIIKGRSCLC